MDRRRATVIAAGVSLTFLLGATAMTANAAILGRQSDNGVGHLSAVPAPAPAPPTTVAATTPASVAPGVAVEANPARREDPRREAVEAHEGRDDDD